MIGNQVDACLAVARVLPVLSREGSTRTVYLKGNVVYKVEDWCDADYLVNRSEYLRMTSNVELPTGVFFPAVELYDVDGIDVIAMEYVEGQAVGECYCLDDEPHTDYCADPVVIELVKPILDDIGGLNVIVNERGIFIIDMG